MTTYDIKDEVRDMDVDSVDKSLVNLKIENPSSINKLMNPTPELAQPSVLVPVSVAPVSIPPISVPPPVVPPSVGGGVGGASGGDTLPTLTVPSVTTLPSFPPPLPKAMHVSPLSELVNPSPSTNGSANGNGHISNIPDGSIRSILAEPPAQEPQMPALEPVQEAAALENYIPSDVNNADAHSVADLDSASDKKLSHAARSYRHIKKKDGEPLWRNEIQFDFQRILFENEERVFTNPFPDPQVPGIGNPEKYTFAELYIRTLSESSKCSKILKERFLSNKEMAISVLKVCLLVNCGRMNTTINFVPEMRSTLRTYHSIPSLQGDPIYGGSKPLQDTPRLKSILKNITMDGVEPYRILDDLLRHPKENKPNTNVIDMIFLLSNHTHSIKFFDEGVNNNLENTFLDFFLNTKIHPNSRARRFLWLIYTYLETSFQPLEIAQNPFGEGNGSTNIPEMEMITEEEYEKEFDVDTEFERKYSEQMKELRQKYLNDEEHNSTPKRGNKSKKEREEEDAMMQQYVEKLAAEKDDGDYFVPSSEGASVSIVEESVTESNPDSTTTVESTESSNGFKLPDDRKRHADLEEIKRGPRKPSLLGLPFHHHYRKQSFLPLIKKMVVQMKIKRPMEARSQITQMQQLHLVITGIMVLFHRSLHLGSIEPKWKILIIILTSQLKQWISY